MYWATSRLKMTTGFMFFISKMIRMAVITIKNFVIQGKCNAGL